MCLFVANFFCASLWLELDDAAAQADSESHSLDHHDWRPFAVDYNKKTFVTFVPFRGYIYY